MEICLIWSKNNGERCENWKSFEFMSIVPDIHARALIPSIYTSPPINKSFYNEETAPLHRIETAGGFFWGYHLSDFALRFAWDFAI